MPVITVQLELERTFLTLTFEKIGDKKLPISARMEETILAHLTDHFEAKASEIAEYIGLKPSRIRDYLNLLVSEDLVVAEGANRNRTYRLKY